MLDAIVKRYLNGKIDAGQFIQELDQKTRMMQLEQQ